MATWLTRIGRSLHNLNVFLFEKNKKVMYVVALILIPGLTTFVFNWEAKDKAGEMLGVSDIQDIIRRFGGGGGGRPDFGVIEDFDQMYGVTMDGDYVDEGGDSDFTITANEEKVIEKVTVTITWEDEQDPPSPRIRRYDNQPDTFSATLLWPDGQNSTDLGRSDSGFFSESRTFTQEEMESLYGLGNFRVRVSCLSAGDWEAGIGLGFLTMPDTGNDIDIQIEEVYWAPPLPEE